MQCQALLNAIGWVDPSDARLITVDLDQAKPMLPVDVTLQI